MRIASIGYIVGALLVWIASIMILPFLVSIYYKDGFSHTFLYSGLLTLFVGLSLFLFFRARKKSEMVLTHREGLAIVGIGWMFASLFGALPFYFSTSVLNITFADAIFESVSGFTTTGASIFSNVEILPKSILFWRSLSHWLGGMGIIVLSLAILPFLGIGGMQLYKAEVPGPSPDKLKPRIQDTAASLWKVYLFFTALQISLYIFGDMPLFDAICHSFSTMATGGFSTKNVSIAFYDSSYIDIVTTIFMIIAGVNFSLYFFFTNNKATELFKDQEFHFYMKVFATITLIITLYLTFSSYYKYGSIGEALRYASFQVASILTTTGFSSANYEQWSFGPQGLLFLCMFIGGCVGSTAGGMKCMRIQLLNKNLSLELHKQIHPRMVSNVKWNNKAISSETLKGVQSFCMLWVALYITCSIVLTLLGVDLLTAFTATAACIANVGPGFGAVGPLDNYGHFSDLVKWVLSFAMLLGRLEIYALFILIVPEFWKK